jgi:hypothetical protein
MLRKDDLMSPQETFVDFKERFGAQVGKLSLRADAGIIHLYAIRWFPLARIEVTTGKPICGGEARYMAAVVVPTADAPTCQACLAAMRIALETE